MEQCGNRRAGGRRPGNAAAKHPGYQLFNRIEQHVRVQAKRFLNYDEQQAENFRVAMLAARMRWRDGLTWVQIVAALKDEGYVRTVQQVRWIFKGL